MALTYLAVVWGFAAFHGYGWFVDELYYAACARHPAPGYVDHPPLSVLILVPIRATFGDSLGAYRLPSALAVAVGALLAGRTARVLGGGAFAQTFAALLAATAPAALVLGGFASMNALELAFGAALAFVAAKILAEDRARLWLAFGALTGLALENKHTFVVVAGAIAAGIVLTPARRHLRTPWPWAGAAIALAVVAPNVLWQWQHGWISLEFYREATRLKNVATSPLGALVGQIQLQGIAGFAAAIAGAAWLLVRPRFRALGVAFVVALCVMLLSGMSRPDRIAAAYTAVYAAAAVLVEEGTARLVRVRAVRGAAVGAVFAVLAPFVPIFVPVLSPDALERYAARLGVTPQIERGKPGSMPQWFADRFGWRETAEAAARAYRTLPPEERAHTVLLGGDYGLAGALQLYGPALGLPRVVCTHNSYWMWGPGDTHAVTTLIAVQRDHESLERIFDRVERAGSVSCAHGYKDGVPVWIARGPKVDLAEVWPRARHLE